MEWECYLSQRKYADGDQRSYISGFDQDLFEGNLLFKVVYLVSALQSFLTVVHTQAYFSLN